jgi:hypothetical protein
MTHWILPTFPYVYESHHVHKLKIKMERQPSRFMTCDCATHHQCTFCIIRTKCPSCSPPLRCSYRKWSCVDHQHTHTQHHNTQQHNTTTPQQHHTKHNNTTHNTQHTTSQHHNTTTHNITTSQHHNTTASQHTTSQHNTTTPQHHNITTSQHTTTQHSTHNIITHNTTTHNITTTQHTTHTHGDGHKDHACEDERGRERTRKSLREREDLGSEH